MTKPEKDLFVTVIERYLAAMESERSADAEWTATEPGSNARRVSRDRWIAASKELATAKKVLESTLPQLRDSIRAL